MGDVEEPPVFRRQGRARWRQGDRSACPLARVKALALHVGMVLMPCALGILPEFRYGCQAGSAAGFPL